MTRCITTKIDIRYANNRHFKLINIYRVSIDYGNGFGIFCYGTEIMNPHIKTQDKTYLQHVLKLM